MADKASGFSSRSSFRWLWPAGMALILCGIVLLADPKSRAVLGRFSYWQFLLALVSLSGLLSTIWICVLSPASRAMAGKRLALSGVVLLVALAGVELVLFAIPPRHQMDNPWYFAAAGGIQASSDFPFERPSHLYWKGLSRGDLAMLKGHRDPYARHVEFRTDRHGFRNDTEITRPDLVFVGDSFTEAGNIPVAETFAFQLGRRLGMTTRNLGRAGYSPPAELLVLKKYALECRPRTVVWQVAEANDLLETVNYVKWIKDGKPPYFTRITSGNLTHREAWKRRSPTYRLFSLLRTDPSTEQEFCGIFRDRAGREHRILFKDLPNVDQVAEGHLGWPAFARSLVEGYELCRANGIRMIVLYMPMKFSVMNSRIDWNDWTRSDLASFSDIPEEFFLATWIRRLCADQGIPWVDATPALKARAEQGDLVYLPLDTHLSALGHEVITELLAAQLAPSGESP